MTIKGCLFFRARASSSGSDWAAGKEASRPDWAQTGVAASDTPTRKSQSRRRKSNKENIVGLEAMNCRPWTISGFAQRADVTPKSHFEYKKPMNYWRNP